MATIPLTLRLRKQVHRDIASAQDIIVSELYGVFDRALLHGGTAVWRCYGGNRFSEDIDFYLPKDVAKLSALFSRLEKKGFAVSKKRVLERSLFASLRLGRTDVRFEALFKKPMPKGVLADYEAADGTVLTVYALTPEELLREKAAAYLDRLKVRDLYDVFFLLRHVKSKNSVAKELKLLVADFRQPVDKGELKVLIMEGLVPEIKDMLDYIRKRI